MSKILELVANDPTFPSDIKKDLEALSGKRVTIDADILFLLYCCAVVFLDKHNEGSLQKKFARIMIEGVENTFKESNLVLPNLDEEI